MCISARVCVDVGGFCNLLRNSSFVDHVMKLYNPITINFPEFIHLYLIATSLHLRRILIRQKYLTIITMAEYYSSVLKWSILIQEFQNSSADHVLRRL